MRSGQESPSGSERIEKFKQFYPMPDPAGASGEVLGKDFETVDEEWMAFLKSR